MHDVLEGHVEPEGHAQSPLTLRVTVTLSILAVLVATATLMGHRSNKEELLLQNQLSDQWSYYQAKNIRLHERQIGADQLAIFTPVDKEKAAEMREKYLKEAERYEKDKDAASEKAKEIEKERDLVGRRGDRYEAGEVLLEIALILASFTLLTNKKFFWYAGSLVGVIGLGVALSGFLLPFVARWP